MGFFGRYALLVLPPPTASGSVVYLFVSFFLFVFVIFVYFFLFAWFPLDPLPGMGPKFIHKGKTTQGRWTIGT
jgi:hypothetical protein